VAAAVSAYPDVVKLPTTTPTPHLARVLLPTVTPDLDLVVVAAAKVISEVVSLTSTPISSLRVLITPSPPITIPISQPTPNIDQLISDSVDHLATGQIAFNPPSEMILGKSYTIFARITKRETDEATIDLKIGISQNGASVQVESVKVSSEMKAELTALKATDVNILALSELEQPLGQKGYTEWEWRVTPQKIGVTTLFLKVSAIIRIPGEDPVSRSIIVDPDVKTTKREK